MAPGKRFCKRANAKWTLLSWSKWATMRFSLRFQTGTTVAFFLGIICTIWALTKTNFWINTKSASRPLAQIETIR